MQRCGSAAGSALRRPKLASMAKGLGSALGICLALDGARVVNNASVTGDWGAFSTLAASSWQVPRVFEWAEQAPDSLPAEQQTSTMAEMQKQINSLLSNQRELAGEVVQLQRSLREEKEK